jgi:CAAX amino terminal protease family protein
MLKTTHSSEILSEDTILHKPIKSCVFIFLILLLVHAFEAIALRMDQTIFAENFINKIFGIVLLFVLLKQLHWDISTIGFKKYGLVKTILKGFALALFSFFIAYTIECSILYFQEKKIYLGFFITGFSLTGVGSIQTGIGFVFINIFFNIINVIMEEGTFRGLFYQLINTRYSLKTALFIQALLFGIWHIVTPLHNWIDGEISGMGFVSLSIGYIILAGMMGVKWGLLYRMTGNLYAGMADHFFNNCIATNLLHVVSNTGIDEYMIFRILIAQIFSFAIVVFLWKRQKIEGLK